MSLLLQVTPGSKQPEVTSQVLMDATLRLCSGELPEGLIDSNNCSSNSPELSASPTGKKCIWYLEESNMNCNI